MPPGEAQLGVDMDDRYAGRYCSLKVAVVSSRTSVESQRYSCRRRDLTDATNVKPLSHAAADHTLEEPMHISDRGSQDVNLRGFDKTLGVIGLRQTARTLRHPLVELRAAADETQLALDDDPRIDRLDRLDSLSGKLERRFDRMLQGMGVIGIEEDRVVELRAQAGDHGANLADTDEVSLALGSGDQYGHFQCARGTRPRL